MGYDEPAWIYSTEAEVWHDYLFYLYLTDQLTEGEDGDSINYE